MHVRDRLRARAQAHGHSVEAEMRDILRTAVSRDTTGNGSGLGTRIADLFAGQAFDEEIPVWTEQSARSITFDRVPGDDLDLFVVGGRVTLIRKRPGAAHGLLSDVHGDPSISDKASRDGALR